MNQLCHENTLSGYTPTEGFHVLQLIQYEIVIHDYYVKYGLQVTFYLPKYCKKVPIYCIKIQVKSWFVAINTSTEK